MDLVPYSDVSLLGRDACKRCRAHLILEELLYLGFIFCIALAVLTVFL